MKADTFTLLAALLEEMGSSYGALPAHDGLWDSAIATSKDLLARLAVEHCVHEVNYLEVPCMMRECFRQLMDAANVQARGLDVLPTTISRFCNGGDNETADLLERVVYPEEITHCAAGVKWFRFLCLRAKNPDALQERMTPESQGIGNSVEDEEIIKKFHATVRAYFRGPLKPPFNEEARKAAGFGLQWYEPLASKEFTIDC